MLGNLWERSLRSVLQPLFFSDAGLAQDFFQEPSADGPSAVRAWNMNFVLSLFHEAMAPSPNRPFPAECLELSDKFVEIRLPWKRHPRRSQDIGIHVVEDGNISISILNL